MARKFIIAGLPRSRTAWCSAFFSNHPIVCYHEPLLRLSDIRDLPGLFQSNSYTHVGVADTAIGYFMPWVMENIEAPTLIIERNIDDVAESLRTIGLPAGKHLDYMLHQMKKVKGHRDVMWVDFDSLRDKRIIRKIWFHLLPGLPFDEGRFERYDELNIVADIAKMLHKLQASRASITNLMRDVLPQITEFTSCQ